MATNSTIPVTATLSRKPSLNEMTVSASSVYKVIKSKDLKKLAKQFLSERKRRSEKRRLPKEFPPSPEKRLKFGRRGDDYHLISETAVPTTSVTPIGWEKSDDELQPESQITEESDESELDFNISQNVPSTQTMPPAQLDLAMITPRPQYIPEKQPEHLQASYVQKTEKTAIERYEDNQEDVKEVIKGCRELKDPEKILCARPDGEVELENGEKGLIEIKSPSSAKHLTIPKAVEQKKITFLVEDQAEETSYRLKKNANYYHQVQAQIYVGKTEGFTFCDFVVYLTKTESISIERITADSDWQKANIPKVREFCSIYNALLKEEDQ